MRKIRRFEKTLHAAVVGFRTEFDERLARQEKREGGASHFWRKLLSVRSQAYQGSE